MKKGFTLIELLAVIVILAIIALIVTPVISNIIKSSKKSAARQSAIGYVKAVDTTNQAELLKSPNLANRFEYEVDINGLGVEASGKVPTAGAVNIIDNKVYSATLCVDNYVIEYKDNNAEIISEDGCNVGTSYMVYDKYDANVGTENVDPTEVNPLWKRYIKTNELNNEKISIELCSNVNGKTVCNSSNKEYQMSDLVFDNNGLLSTELCSNLSQERITALEENGVYKVHGFTCSYDGEVYEYAYKERILSSQEHFIPARVISQIIEKGYANGKKSTAKVEKTYFTEKDIRSDVLDIIKDKDTWAKIDAIPTADFNKVRAYFQTSGAIYMDFETRETFSDTAKEVKSIVYGLKTGSSGSAFANSI